MEILGVKTRFIQLSHYKLFICDNTFYVNGSYNIISNPGAMWHEGGEYSEDPIMIASLKQKYFNTP